MNGTKLEQSGRPAGAAPRRAFRRWLPYFGALAILAAIVAGLWPRPVPVETEAVALGKLRATVNEEGKTRIRHRYVVSAPVSGQLRRIPFRAGEEVKAGETIVATIDPLAPNLLDPRTRRLLEARLEGARASLEKARTAHQFALSELKRFEKLFADDAVSAQSVDSARTQEQAAGKDVTYAEGVVKQVEAELAEFASGTAQTNAAPREVVAPASGRVLRVIEENARVVTAGTPLLEIGDPSDLEVVVEVLSQDGAGMGPGTRMELVQWGGPEPLEARVRLVEPAAFTKVSALGVEEQRVNVVADLVTPPDKRPNVGHGFRVDARIVVWESENALKVPVGALFRHEEGWAAFVVENGQASLREVRAGRSSGTETQVLEGLKEGETVIIYPGGRVHDGVRVRPIKV